MNAQEFELRAGEFYALLKEAEDQAEGFREIFMEKKVPARESLDQFRQRCVDLRERYERAAAAAKEILPPEEVPAAGSGFDRYEEAVMNSRMFALRKLNDKAAQVFSRFIRIRSDIASYDNVLKPYRDAVKELLDSLPAQGAEEIEDPVKSSELFLNILDAEKAGEEDVFSMLEEAIRYYPPQVQWGLAGHRYYIEETKAEETAAAEDAGTDDGKADAPRPEEEKEKEETVHDSAVIHAEALETEIKEERETETPCYTDAVHDKSVCEDAPSGDDDEKKDACHPEEPQPSVKSSDEVEKEKETDLPEKTVKALNRLKHASPGASAFINEFIKIARTNIKAGWLLPTITFAGAFTQDQAEDMYWLLTPEDWPEREQGIGECLKSLVKKGLFAKYRLDYGGEDIEAYCATSYCLSCLAKKTVMETIPWMASFGSNRVEGREEMDYYLIASRIYMNDCLLKVLECQNLLLSKEEYDDVRRSVSYSSEDYFYIDIIKDGIAYRSKIARIPDDLQKDGYENMALCMESDDTLEELKEDIAGNGIGKEIRNIFIIDENAVYRLVCKNGELVFCEDDAGNEQAAREENAEDVHVEASVPQDIPAGKDAAAKDTGAETHDMAYVHEKDGAGVNEPEDECAGEDAGEDVSFESMVNSRTAPSDKELCVAVLGTLVFPADSMEDLRDNIASAVLLAAGASMEKDRPAASRLYSQLRLATHMAGGTLYSAEKLAEAFPDPENSIPALLLASLLFAMLNPSVPYDYTLRNQTLSYFSDYDGYFEGYGSFKPLFNKLLSVYPVSPTGFSPSVISLIGTEAEKEAFLDELRKEAKNLLVVQAPKTRMKVLPILYSNCFGPSSDLYACMEIIAEGKDDAESIALVESVLEDYCTGQDDVFTLSDDKVEEMLDRAWGPIVAKNNNTTKMVFKLEYEAHDQAIRQFETRIDLMLTWYEQMKNISSKGEQISRLRILKKDILDLCDKTESEEDWKNGLCSGVLRWVLMAIRAYLGGEYAPLAVFSKLLSTGAFSFNDDGTPRISVSTAQVRYYEPWRRALLHIMAKGRPLGEVKDEILGDSLDSAGEEAGLKDNLHQLMMIGRFLGSTDEDYVITEQQIKEAAASADARTRRFMETLELAYTYGQISETEKETILGIMNSHKERFYETADFANWRRFLEALEKQIAENAGERKDALLARLSTCLEKSPGLPILLRAEKLIKEDTNLAVAEEYLNRYDAGEPAPEEGLADASAGHSYFTDFLDGHAEDILRECRRNDGRTLRSFAWNYAEKRLPAGWTSRLLDDTKAMLSRWPSRRDSASAEQMKAMFTDLGFDVTRAEKMTGYKEEMFRLFVRPAPRSMADYRHPIAAFGTLLKSPVNVVLLYGNHTEKQLVDTISGLGLGGITIVLLDRPLDAARRRLIGEIFHTQTSGQNPFLLIDQVLFIYLAMHQVTERLPALLMCTLPYTSYQPFVRDGGSTADEMFCGRTQELATLIDPNGACVVYGGRQLGKTALLERVESRCSKPENRAYAVYSSIVRMKSEEEVVTTLVSDIERKTDGKIKLDGCSTLKDMCRMLSTMFRDGRIISMHLLIDEVDDFLASIADRAYAPLQPLIDLKRETKSAFKFVIAGLHNVCRAKNATKKNGVFGQLGTPLCIRPLSPSDAAKLLSLPLSYLGFKADSGPHLETILTNTNYYPGILQFFGYTLVQTLSGQYTRYYRAADGAPPFVLQNEQLGAVMSSADLNKSIRDKFRWSLELDARYFMIARCLTMLYHCYEGSRDPSSGWLGFKVEEIIEMARLYDIHCLENETADSFKNLLDEMVEMGILSSPAPGMYRLRRSSFIGIIGEDMDRLEQEIIAANEEEG